MVLDETAELKKGTKTVGVARQHAGITGQVENCQTSCSWPTSPPARTPCSISASTCRRPGARRERRERARVPDDVPFTTKPALGTAMIAGVAAAGVPFAWVAGDEVYGRSQATGSVREGREGIRVRGPGELHRHPALGRKTTMAAVAG